MSRTLLRIVNLKTYVKSLYANWQDFIRFVFHYPLWNLKYKYYGKRLQRRPAHTKEIAVHFCGSLAFQNRPINVLTL